MAREACLATAALTAAFAKSVSAGSTRLILPAALAHRHRDQPRQPSAALGITLLALFCFASTASPDAGLATTTAEAAKPWTPGAAAAAKLTGPGAKTTWQQHCAPSNLRLRHFALPTVPSLSPPPARHSRQGCWLKSAMPSRT